MKKVLPLKMVRLVPALAIVAAQILPLPSAVAAESCASILSIYKAPAGVVYSKGVDPKKNPDDFMQIGYESEYLFSEAAPLLRDYLPDAKIMSKENWLAMSDQQRVDWLKAQFQNRPEFATSAGLKKNVNLDYMPDELIIDSTGNVEIVLAPFNTYRAWEQAVDTIVQRYGVGSQQAMISKSRQSAFAPKNQKAQHKLHEQHLGWLNFSNLKDTFAKLDSGYDRYKKDPTKLTALSFDHAFLGPMNKIKRDVLENYLTLNASGQKYDDASKMFVRKSDASFKYTGGPSYRPDVAGPGRFSWELRNSHKDLADLKMKVKRDFVAHREGLEPYAVFAKVPAFDSMKTFETLPANVKETLKTIFPTKADPRFNYSREEHMVLEVYRNFSLPMQNFTAMTKALTSSHISQAYLQARIAFAQKAYLNGLNQVAQKFAAKQLDVNGAKARVMGLLGEFTRNSGIAHAFELKAKQIGHENVEVETQTPAEKRKGAQWTPANKGIAS